MTSYKYTYHAYIIQSVLIVLQHCLTLRTCALPEKTLVAGEKGSQGYVFENSPQNISSEAARS